MFSHFMADKKTKIEIELGQIFLNNNSLKIANKSTEWLTKNYQSAFFVKKIIIWANIRLSFKQYNSKFFYFERFQIFMNHLPVHTLRMLSIQAEFLRFSLQKWVKLEQNWKFLKKFWFWQNFKFWWIFTQK